MKRLILNHTVLASVTVVILTGCAVTPNKVPAELPVKSSAVEEAEVQPVFGSAEDTPVSDVEEKRPAEIYLGTNQTFKPAKSIKPVSIHGDAVTLNFESTPLEDVVHGILGDILGLEYIIEDKIPGNVTLRTQAPVERNELLVILESMLAANGVNLLQQDDGRYLITASKNFSSRFPRYNSPGSSQIGYSNLVVPLEHIDAAQMVEILQPVAPESAFVRIDGIRNLLILAGTSVQLSGWLDIIEMFDVDYLKGMSVGIFPVEYTSVEEVKAAINTLMSTASGGKDAGEGSGLIRMATLESLSSLLVVTSRKELLSKIETWIDRFDRAPAQSAEPQLFVYTVQNGTAEHLADLLRSIFGGGGSSSSLSSRRNEGVAPGLTSSSLGSGDASTTTTGAASANRTGSSGASSFMLGDTVRVVADDVNNSLLVYATSGEYRKIRSALQQLDVMPSQILIEASIIEVQLNDNLEYGLKWYFDHELSNGKSGIGNIGMSVSSDGGVSASVPSFGYAFSDAFGNVQAVLSALAGKELIKVLSTPSLMVLDNQSASIQVGDSQPVLSSTTNGDYGSTQNISYRDTGVQLEVTPSVNAGGLVTMEINQAVTDVGSGGTTDSPSFFQRTISSKVAVRSGESVVLGGLISDKKSSNRSGIPFLSDLPIIGGLFGGTTVDESRQELLVIITPQVIKTDQDIRDITAEMRRRMRGLQSYQDSIDHDKLIGK